MSRATIDPELLTLAREGVQQPDAELLDMARSAMADEQATNDGQPVAATGTPVIPAGMPGGMFGNQPRIPVQQVPGPQQAETWYGDIGSGLARGVGIGVSQLGGAMEATGTYLPGAIGRRLVQAGQETTQMGEADTAQFAPTRTLPGQIAESVPGAIGTAAAALTTGGWGGVLMGAGLGGAQAGGDQYNAAKERALSQGGSIDQARAIAAREAGPVGFVSAVTGLIPVQRILGRVSPQVAQNVLARLSGNRAARLIGDAALEGSQEAAEELASMAAQWAYEADPNAFQGGLSRVRDAAIGGAVLGPLVGGAVEVATGGLDGGTRAPMGTPENVALPAQGDAAQAVGAAGDTVQPGRVRPTDVADPSRVGREVGSPQPPQAVAQDALDSGSVSDQAGRSPTDPPQVPQQGSPQDDRIAVLNDPNATDEQVQAALDSIASGAQPQDATGQVADVPQETPGQPAPIAGTPPATVPYDIAQLNADAERAANLRFLSDNARITGQSPERYVTGREPVSVQDATPERSFDIGGTLEGNGTSNAANESVNPPRATPDAQAEPTTPEGWKALARELGVNDKGLWQVVRKRVRAAQNTLGMSGPKTKTAMVDAIARAASQPQAASISQAQSDAPLPADRRTRTGQTGATTPNRPQAQRPDQPATTPSQASASPTVGKEPWEMTRGEWRSNRYMMALGNTDTDPSRRSRVRSYEGRSMSDRSADTEHRSSVEAAVEQGKPVPAAVLKDYPDLASRFNETPSVSDARYAKGQKAVSTPSSDGWKTRAARLAEVLGGRWTHREKAYIMSPTKAAKFEKMYADGWDANDISKELEPPASAPKSAAKGGQTSPGVEKESTSGEGIRDAGEKIGDAKKDRWRSRGLTVDDLASMNEREAVKYATKDNAWPADYASMIRGGADPAAVHAIKQMRDAVASRPMGKGVTPSMYVDAISRIRRIMDGVKTVQDAKGVADAILAEFGYKKDSPLAWRMSDEAKALFSVYKGRKFPFRFSGYKTETALRSGWPEPRRADGDWFEVKPSAGGTFSLHRKGRYSPLPRLTNFKSEAEAAAYAREHFDKAGRQRSTDPVRPELADVQRVGENVRGDKPVGSETLRADFGFRGVEFGNWMTEADRQQAMNHAYDAFSDLAEAMGVPPSVLSLDGTLGAAFGSRGSGRYSAHYEPTRKVFNLTKTRGDGSLAHEWAHAFDDYLGGLAGHGGGLDDFASHRTGDKNSALRPELQAAIKHVMDTLRTKNGKNTELYMAVRALDARKKTPYWSTPREMFARGFETWVHDKITESGRRSDYLVAGITEEEAKRVWKGAFATGEERAAMNKAFQSLMDAIEVQLVDTAGNKVSSVKAGSYPSASEARRADASARSRGLRHRAGIAINPIEEVIDLVRRAGAARGKAQAVRARDVARIEQRGARKMQAELDRSTKASERIAKALGDTEAKRDAYRDVLKQSRKDLQNARTTIRDMGVRIAKADAKIEKAKAADDARRVVTDIAAKVPLRVRGKLMVAVRDAATLADVYAAAGKAAEIITKDLGRSSIVAIEKYTGKRLTGSMSEQARSRLLEIKVLADEATRRFKAPIASAGEAAAELAGLADEAKSIIHQHRIENKLIRLGRFLDANIERANVIDALKGRGQLAATEDGKGLAQPGIVKRMIRKNMNAGTIAMLIDGGKGGAVGRLFDGMKKGRRRAFELREAVTHLADAAASKAGYDNLAHLMATTSGTLGKGLTETQKITLGGRDFTLTLGELAKLYSTEQDVSTRRLIAAGKPIQFRTGGTFSEPITLTEADFNAVREAIPSQIAGAIDAMKVARDKMFPAVQKVIRTLKGYEPPRENGYEPRTINRELSGNADAELQPDLSGAIDKHLENAGFTIARVDDKVTPLVIGDFFEDWTRTVGGQADIIGMATEIANARVVLMHKDVKAAIGRVYGDKMVDRLRSVLVDAAGLRAPTKGGVAVVQRLTRNVSYAMTALKPKSWFMQLAGVPRLWAEMDTRAFAHGLRKAFSPGVGERMLEGSPMLRARYSQTMAAVNTSLADPSSAMVLHNQDSVRDVLRTAKHIAASAGSNIREMDVRGLFGKSLPEFFDLIRFSNFFDSIPARIAWAGHEWQARRDGHDAAWVREKTEDTLDKVLNSSDPMHISGWTSDYRNTAMVPFTAFTSDQTSAWNQVAQGFLESRAKGMRALTGVALGSVWASGLAGFSAYLGKTAIAALSGDDDESEEERQMAALSSAATRFLQETVGSGFASGKVVDMLTDAANRRNINVADAPLVGTANQTLAGLAGMGRSAWNATGDDEKADRAAEDFIDALLRFSEGSSALTGNPLAPHIGTLRKAIKAAND